MSDAALSVVVTYRHLRWARLRVRGLLGDATLGRIVREHFGDAVEVSSATGTVKVPLSQDRPEARWIEELSALASLRGEAAGSGRETPASCDQEVGSREADGSRRAASSTGAATRAGRTRPAAPALAISTPAIAAPAVSAPDRIPTTVDDLPAHGEPIDRLLARLGAGAPVDRARGLDPDETARRLRRDGPNEIADVAGRSSVRILLDQFSSVPVALLGGSAALALATRAFADAGAIGVVLAANGALGFVTEQRAERTVSSLRKLRPHQALVLRGGEELAIDAREVVVGDILVLRPGDAIAADARVLEAHRLATNEAALTGESLPVRKEPRDGVARDAPIGERDNMVYLGTVVSGGTGRAIVVATGEATELGHIRRLAQGAEAPGTRLQNELDALGRRLAIGSGALCLLVFAIGLARGRPMLPLLRTAISLGVAAIPEGLPTVATSLLAASIHNLQAREIYARRLDAIESLGAIDTVCFDKTGTLTQNRMSVASITVGAELRMLEDTVEPAALPLPWLQVAVLCNTVERDDDDAGAPWRGSSTEIALLEFAIAQGADARGLRRAMPALEVRHRSEHHPYMVTLHQADDEPLLVAVKGRPDQVLARCEDWFDGTRTRALSADLRAELLRLNDSMAALGHRVLALAYRRHPARAYGDTAGLTWLGLEGLSDPLRPELPAMVDRFRAAGIRSLMITGDQPGTASAVAERIGMTAGDAPMIDAANLLESADALVDVVDRAAGFARTSPAMKREIVRALQRRGHVVAMTGDGINDGPALKTADVGVAMGVTGTDFAHAMSDLVLRDDHPAAILTAIEQGRTVFVNVKKSVRYLVSTNLSELAATTIAVAAGLPEPFDPMALLWTNIATDIWPAIALGLEPAEPGILQRPPVSLREGLLDRREWSAIATDAGTMTAAALLSFGIGLSRHGTAPQARTMAFMTLTTSQLLYAFSMRSPRPLRAGGLQPNPMLRHAVGWTLLAQAGTVALPFARRLLRTTPLAPVDLVVALGAATLPLVVRELLKERQK